MIRTIWHNAADVFCVLDGTVLVQTITQGGRQRGRVSRDFLFLREDCSGSFELDFFEESRRG